ncbi:MAG: DUF2304 domain-containing protein [Clostridium sp.]
MPSLLRIEMLIIAIVFMIVVIKSINERKLWLQYSLIWIVIAVGLIVFAVFPQVVEWAAHLAKIETPSNFIYLLAIIALSAITFSLTIITSKQSQKIKTIVQLVSIEKYLEKRGEEDNE